MSWGELIALTWIGGKSPRKLESPGLLCSMSTRHVIWETPRGDSGPPKVLGQSPPDWGLFALH